MTETILLLACAILSVVTINMMVSYISERRYYVSKFKTYEKLLKSQEQKIFHINNQNKRVREIRHDIKHHMAMLKELIDEGAYDELREYVTEMCGKVDSEGQKVYTGICTIDSVLGKFEKATNEKGIDINWQGSITKYRGMELFDACVLFMNIMSNAVEACEKLENATDRVIDVNVYDYEGRLYIKQSNKYVGDVSLKDGIPVTTKKNKKNHGIGCANIRNVIRKYDGYLKYNFDDGIMNLEIII